MGASRRCNRRQCLRFSVALLPTRTLAAVPAFAWPGGAAAAVSLGYDDGLASHLDHVLPALNRRGLRASFYLPINSPTLPGRLEDWRAAARAGHELGNHSLFHGCSASLPGREWVPAEHDLDHLTPRQVQAQVIAANTWLRSLDGRAERTFTPPCLDAKASGADFLADLHPHFVGYRTQAGGLNRDPARLDPYGVGVDFIEGHGAAELIAKLEAAVEQRALLALLFHGVGAEHLQVSREAHDALLDALAARRASIWTDSFVNILGHVRREQARLGTTIGR